jgi:outer membrane lipoprotein-sorting protein
MKTFVALSAVALAMCSCSKTNKLDGFEGDITMHTTAGTNSQDMVVEVKKDQLRFDMNSPQGGAMHGVFDPKANKVTLYADATKTYTDMDFSGPSGKTNTNPDTSAITQSGKHETIAGYDCEDWTVNDPSGKKSEVCIAQGIAFFDVGSLRGGASASGSAIATQFREKKSFPLRSVEYDAAGKEQSRMEVTKIESKSLDDSRFATPAGYTKLTLPAH